MLHSLPHTWYDTLLATPKLIISISEIVSPVCTKNWQHDACKLHDIQAEGRGQLVRDTQWKRVQSVYVQWPCSIGNALAFHWNCKVVSVRRLCYSTSPPHNIMQYMGHTMEKITE